MWCGGLNDKVTEEVRSVLYPLCCTLFLVRRYGHREGETKYYSFAKHEGGLNDAVRKKRWADTIKKIRRARVFRHAVTARKTQ